ncbi:hypothetical protein ACWD00_32170 [Streptomyces viridiviolaceus]
MFLTAVSPITFGEFATVAANRPSWTAASPSSVPFSVTIRTSRAPAASNVLRAAKAISSLATNT